MRRSRREEKSPLLPSGEWEGFYIYQPGGNKHRMALRLHFYRGKASGGGRDDIGRFTWTGTYDLKTMRCNFLKSYATHAYDYRGSIDDNGIFGSWHGYFMQGGFHIWPKTGEEAQEAVARAKKTATRKVKNRQKSGPVNA